MTQQITALTQPFTLLILGGEGVGKSSTLNAITGKTMAVVGEGFDPQTIQFTPYQVGKLTLWDSPAINSSNHADLKQFLATHKIDHILLLNEAGSRDLGHLFTLLNELLPKAFTEQATNKITLGLNHADIALSGRGWIKESAQPNNELNAYLQGKCESVAKRLQQSTGLETAPLYFCSGFNDGVESLAPYRIEELVTQLLPQPVTLTWWEKLWQWFSPQSH